MFAINHAATALLIKKLYPDVPIAPILVSVQLIEILWVTLNYLGVETTTTEERVESVKDVHLKFMPYSHSILSTLLIAAVAGIAAWAVFRRLDVGAAVSLGVCSHIVLDLLSHARDIAPAPVRGVRKLGLGLYEKPPAAFVFETVYGIFCWRVYGGGMTLFWIILLFNLANIPFFFKAIPGPERLLSRRPVGVTTVVALQIVVTAVLVGLFS